MSVIPKPEPKSRRSKNPEVVVDEANATSTSPNRGVNNSTSRSPNARSANAGNNKDIAALAGLGASTMSKPGVPGALSQGSSTFAGLGLSGLPGMDIVANIKETVSKAAERAANKVKPGSVWGSRNVPEVRKYELDSKFKPKVKEETKKAAKAPSKLAAIKKEEIFVKEKNPGIPSHKVAKKPVAATDAQAVEGQENTTANKPAPKVPGNTVVHAGKGSVNAFDPLAALTGNAKLSQLKKLKQQ